MEFIAALFSESPYVLPINHVAGWFAWLIMAGVIAFGLRYRWENPWSVLRRRWWVLLLLILATPFTSTIGVRLPGQTLPLPGVPYDSGAPILMFLAALPWVLAAGLLGPFPAVLVGMLSGLMLGLYSTHNPFSILEIAGLALLFSYAVRQRYRTPLYRLLRHPLGAGVILAVAYSPIYMLTSLFAVNASLASRIDFALTQTWQSIMARGGELIIASLIGEVLYLTMPLWWGCLGPLLPSPAESNLQSRFFLAGVPLVFVLLLALTLGDWLVAGNAARRMVEDRLSSTSNVAVESLPYFMESGQSLIQTLATSDLVDKPEEETNALLATRIHTIPFFRQLTVFDASGKPLGGYPQARFDQIIPAQEEINGINLALSGVLFQTYTIPPMPGESSAQVSFLAAIPSVDGEIVGVLLGRTDLLNNPFTQPAIEALEGLGEFNGHGFLLDENNRIIYPVESSEITEYSGALPQDTPFFEDILPDGTRSHTYFRRAEGRPWAIVLAVPAQYTQEMALNIAVPLLAILLLVTLAAFVMLRYILGSMTTTLRNLSRQATWIMRGDLNQSVQVRGEDEIGQLASAFERMRASLKSRLDELNRLLVVSQGVAAHLEIHDDVQPILAAAIQDGACLARVVLVNEVTLEPRQPGPVAFGAGTAAEQYKHLDGLLFDVMRHQDLMPLPTVARMRRLNITQSLQIPGALIALAIRHKDQYFGTFWLAFDTSHTFSDEEVRFLSTLAGQIALAAFSSRMYAQSEVGRQRLEAVLASTPEPVLVFDDQTRLLLLNTAALQVPGLVKSAKEGGAIQDVLGSTELINWLSTPLEKRPVSKDITLSNGRTYFTSVSAVQGDGRPVGRICLLRDITQFKELNQLKSDFVATVSHDLRSPLTLMRGYATMLQMVGELNDQQKSYVKKIVGGVETMTKLVNNLLDLGRIEAGIGLQIEKVIVQQVIDEVVNSLQAQAVQKDIQLSQVVNGEGPLAVIEADRALIQQALYNLVDNAIKYTAVKGQVKLRMEVKAATVLLQVVDTGIGIAPLDLPRLFEKFYRSGRREAYQQRGTGLGLAIVKSITERHNGRVWVDSQLGKGSVFSLELPIRQSQPEMLAVSKNTP
jgi:signal transduction histidine kinase/HAMP domain-containing protein